MRLFRAPKSTDIFLRSESWADSNLFAHSELRMNGGMGALCRK
jgi:hypothetical protein